MWVLIFYLGAGYGGGPSTIDGFTTQINCEVAAASLVTKFDGFNVSVKTLCIKKD